MIDDYEKATEDIMKIFSDPFFQKRHGDQVSELMEIEFWDGPS